MAVACTGVAPKADVKYRGIIGYTISALISATDDVMKHLFCEFSDEQIDDFFNGILKLSKGIDALDQYYQKSK